MKALVRAALLTVVGLFLTVACSSTPNPEKRIREQYTIEGGIPERQDCLLIRNDAQDTISVYCRVGYTFPTPEPQ